MVIALYIFIGMCYTLVFIRLCAARRHSLTLSPSLCVLSERRISLCCPDRSTSLVASSQLPSQRRRQDPDGLLRENVDPHRDQNLDHRQGVHSHHLGAALSKLGHSRRANEVAKTGDNGAEQIHPPFTTLPRYIAISTDGIELVSAVAENTF